MMNRRVVIIGMVVLGVLAVVGSVMGRELPDLGLGRGPIESEPAAVERAAPSTQPAEEAPAREYGVEHAAKQMRDRVAEPATPLGFFFRARQGNQAADSVNDNADDSGNDNAGDSDSDDDSGNDNAGDSDSDNDDNADDEGDNGDADDDNGNGNDDDDHDNDNDNDDDHDD